MRSLIVRVLGTAIAFYVTNLLVAGFKLHQTWQSYLLASFIFVLLNFLAGPITKLLLLPINLLTLGLFRWVSNVIVLYLFDLIYDGISISAYQFPGYSSGFIALPPGHINLFFTLVISSFIISLTYSIFSSLFTSE